MITAIDSGDSFTIAVTDQGEVWAWGNNFLELIDQNSQTPIQLKKPKDTMAKRCWVNKSGESYVAFVEFEHTETKKRHIYSAGKSEYGLLGQGDKVTESRSFKKIVYANDKIEYTQLGVGPN